MRQRNRSAPATYFNYEAANSGGPSLFFSGNLASGRRALLIQRAGATRQRGGGNSAWRPGCRRVAPSIRSRTRVPGTFQWWAIVLGACHVPFFKAAVPRVPCVSFETRHPLADNDVPGDLSKRATHLFKRGQHQQVGRGRQLRRPLFYDRSSLFAYDCSSRRGPFRRTAVYHCRMERRRNLSTCILWSALRIAISVQRQRASVRHPCVFAPSFRDQAPKRWQIQNRPLPFSKPANRLGNRPAPTEAAYWPIFSAIQLT